jgi:hypothetical protein
LDLIELHTNQRMRGWESLLVEFAPSPFPHTLTPCLLGTTIWQWYYDILLKIYILLWTCWSACLHGCNSFFSCSDSNMVLLYVDIGWYRLLFSVLWIFISCLENHSCHTWRGLTAHNCGWSRYMLIKSHWLGQALQ